MPEPESNWPSNRYRKKLGLRLRRRHYHQPARLKYPHTHAHHSSNPGDPPGDSPDVALLTESVEKQKDQLLRMQAEFENYRRRSRRELEEAKATASSALLEKLLPVLDNFSRAMKTASISPEGFTEGVKMIYDHLLSLLKEAGLETLDALGQPFDPNIHEAVAVDHSGEFPENQVVDVLQDGYMMKGKLIRPAIVRVARAS